MADKTDVAGQREPDLPNAGSISHGAATVGRPSGGGLLQVFWRRRLIIMVCLLLGVGAAFVYLRITRPVYVSKSRIYVQQSGPAIMRSDERGDRTSGNYINNECQVLRSGPILGMAMEAPGIKELRTFAGAESPIDLLSKGLNVVAGKNDDLITVSFESFYPEDAAAVANAVVNAYTAYQSTRKRNTATEILAILQKEKVKRDSEVESSLKEFLEFKRLHPELGFQNEKGNTIIQKLDRLSQALTEAELQLIDANADHRSAMAMKDDPAKIRQFFEIKRAMGGEFGSPQDETSRLEADVEVLRQQHEALKRQYPTSHPAVVFSEKQVAEAIGKVKEHEASSAATRLAIIEQRLKIAVEKHDRTKSAYDAQLQSASGLNKAIADNTRLEDAWQKAVKLADVLDQRIRELNVTEDVGALNISVLEPAVRPGSPARPQPTRVAALSVAGGLLVGVGLALLRNLTDKRLVSPDDISDRLGVPVLGVLPKVRGQALEELGRIVLDAPSMPVAEAYRSLRTALRFGSRASGARKILITSPLSGEGKSTVASNLAILMAQAGRRVLLIDADIRWPRQHEVFLVPNTPGLSEVLSGQAAFDKAVRRSSEAGVDILPAGHLEGNPADILNTQAFLNLMAGLEQDYDVVLVDSPPVMLATDSHVLAAVCDGTVLVLRSGRSKRDMARLSLEGLLGVGARVLGVVVNDVRKTPGRQAYYGAYYKAPGDRTGGAVAVAEADGNEAPAK